MTDTLIAPRGIHLADPQDSHYAPAISSTPAVNSPPAVSSPPAVNSAAGSPPAVISAAGSPSAVISVPKMGWKRRLVRFGVLALVIGGIGVAAATLPLHDIADAVVGLGPGAAVAIAVVGGLLLSVLVPRTAITLACGALLGPATGAATALAAAVLAAIATYYAGRWAGRGALAARAGGRLDRLDGWLNRRGLSAVLLVRFLPLAPFGLIGYAYGTTTVCRKRYLLGTTLASIPSAITYAVIGAAVTAPGQMNPLTIAPALVGIALTTTIVVRWRRSAKRAAAQEASAQLTAAA